MTGFARRPLAVFVCCLFAGAQTSHAAIDAARAVMPAEEMAGASAAAGIQDLGLDSLPPVALRLERKFELLAAKEATVERGYQPVPVPGIPMPEDEEKPQAKEDGPVFITADRVEGRSDEVTEAEGDAELRKVGVQLFADKLTYWPLEDEVEAIGNVRFQQNEDEISGPHMRMKLSEQIGFFEEADYKIVKEVASDFYTKKPIKAKDTTVSATTTTSGAPLMLNVPQGYGLPLSVAPRRRSEGYGHAERIDFEGENQISLNDTSYSTCKPGDTDWYLKAEKMHLDYDREVGEASNAAVYFKDVPFFYLPTASFPLNNRRKSGILPGTFATSSRNGADVTVPYYWNIAPNYDATFYPRYMSKRGFQLGAETEFLGYNYHGHVKAEYLSDDDIEKRSRYAYGIKHQHHLGQGVNLKINWNGVSDDTYWEDFSSRLLQTSQSQLPRQLELSYAIAPGWSSSLQTLRYQTLSPDPANPVARPYFIEPQLAVTGRDANYQDLADLSFYGQYTRFTHPEKVEGGRLVAYPQISVPYIAPAFIVVPKFGLHASQYSLDNQLPGNPSSISRVVPTFTLDSSVIFERQGSWFGSDHIQTLEPRLYYVYIPYRNQDRIPVFDSGIADFNFAQIFTENRYTGFDRINDANQLTAAVTTRFLDAATGAERFKAMVGQRYYFKQQQVTLSSAETARLDNFSNFLAAFQGLVVPDTYVDAAWEYDYHRSQNQRFSVGARFQPELAKVLSAGYRYTRDALGAEQVKQIDIAGQWPIAPRWYAVGRYNYSIRDKQLLEGIAGVEYNAGCWASRFVVQRLEAVGGKPNNTFFFQLELNDFASVGSNPIQLLRRTIPGYGKVNEMPTSGSLLTSE